MRDNVWQTITLRCLCPSGTLWVQILEEDNKPFKFIVTIGKAGTEIRAWTDAVGLLMTRLVAEIGVNGLIDELSDISSMGSKRQGDIDIRSGVEAIVWCLYRYREEKQLELDKSLGQRVERDVYLSPKFQDLRDNAER